MMTRTSSMPTNFWRPSNAARPKATKSAHATANHHWKSLVGNSPPFQIVCGRIVFGGLFPTNDFQWWFAVACALFVAFGRAAFDGLQKFVGIELVLVIILHVAALIEFEEHRELFIRR